MGYPSYMLGNVVDSELVMERGWRDMAPTCPRCGSSNTKFCYYNNYSLTQPRYFCKGCRRYWTKGGSLRNVPVGGGCRKSRRSRSSSALRLTTHHPSSTNHHGITSSRNNTDMFGGHSQYLHQQHNQGQLGEHSSYGNFNNNNMVDSPSDSEAPPIDLAVVYANFLTQKPEDNPQQPLVELSSSIPDATTIAPSSQVVLQLQVQQELPTFSQPLPIIPDELLMMNIDHHHHNNSDNQVLFETDYSGPIHHHQQHDELALPPLPGDSLILQDDHQQQQQQQQQQKQQQQPVSWEGSGLNEHHHLFQQQHGHCGDGGNGDLEVPIRLQDLDSSDSQFSNLLFNNHGSWSPLDHLQGFETSSSSSKP